jgi:DNA-binding NarL/FixJ family response regulator
LATTINVIKEKIMSTVQVHIMHADPVLRAGIAAILAHREDMRLSLPEAPSYSSSGVAVIVTDHQGGIDLCRQRRHASSPRVLVLTQHDKEGAVRQALDAGVHGYLLQSCAPDELVKAVCALRDGQRYLSETVARCVADSVGRSELTVRETDVLKLLGKGYCNKTIARELGIAPGTVKTYVKGVLGKLNATARTHAVVLASERGLISMT